MVLMKSRIRHTSLWALEKSLTLSVLVQDARTCAYKGHLIGVCFYPWNALHFASTVNNISEPVPCSGNFYTPPINSELHARTFRIAFGETGLLIIKKRPMLKWQSGLSLAEACADIIFLASTRLVIYKSPPSGNKGIMLFSCLERVLNPWIARWNLAVRCTPGSREAGCERPCAHPLSHCKTRPASIINQPPPSPHKADPNFKWQHDSTTQCSCKHLDARLGWSVWRCRPEPLVKGFFAHIKFPIFFWE